jgi:hypothetical protein
MRLDHVSYVASHDQISDVVQRIGSQIGTAFVDGGIHPRFGTRNFTAPLLNGQYIEVVCPLDHPAAEQTPFGKAVTRKANEGGGWLTWVISTSHLNTIEEIYGRKAIDGHRLLPTGQDLSWKQIGIIELNENPQFPFFIEWEKGNHPSTEGNANTVIDELQFILRKESKLFPNDLMNAEVLEGISIKIENSDDKSLPTGLHKVTFRLVNGVKVTID